MRNYCAKFRFSIGNDLRGHSKKFSNCFEEFVDFYARELLGQLKKREDCRKFNLVYLNSEAPAS